MLKIDFLENWNFSFQLYEDLEEDIWFEKIAVEESVSPDVKNLMSFFLIARKPREESLIWKKNCESCLTSIKK